MNISRPDREGALSAFVPSPFPQAEELRVPEETLEASHIVGFDGNDERSRAFNLLRSQYLRDIASHDMRLVGVSSATPAAGKSFIALNLAAALSRIGGRAVLLCDFDLRRGSVLSAVQGEVDVDLCSYLRGEVADWKQAVRRINDTACYILPCIAHKRGTGEMITSPWFETLIADLRNLPDEVLVVCDLPPVFASDDALLTARHLDGYLLVVEYGRNTQTQVREALDMFKPTPCVGTILNRYRGGFYDAYGYGYGDPYGLKRYYGDED